MSDIIFMIGTLLILAIPVMSIILLVRFLMKKSCKRFGKIILICLGAIIPIFIIGALTNPATWCEHEYAVIEEVASTCTEKGKVVEKCPLCEREKVNLIDQIPHSWGDIMTVAPTCIQQGYTKSVCLRCSTEDIVYTDKSPHQWVEHSSVDATCTEKGTLVKKCVGCSIEEIDYIETLPHSFKTESVHNATCVSSGYTIEKCTVCSTTQRTNEINALGHSLKESSRIEPTHKAEGKIVFRCERCTHEETQTLEKLPPLTYVEGVDFAEIYRAFKANELRAKDEYKNKRFRITAQVQGIETDGLLNLTGGATLTMLVKVENTYVFFLAEFDKAQEEMLKTINVGDTITFEGECLSGDMFTHCEIIK